MERRTDNQQFGPIYQFSCDPILLMDQGLNVLECNLAAEGFFKKPITELVGVHFCDLFDCNQSLALGYTVKDCLLRSVQKKEAIHGIELLLSGHDFRYGEISGFHFLQNDMMVFAVMIRDITEKVFSRGQLEEWARTDPLTGLLNRRSLEKELTRLFMCAERYHDVFCMTMIDLDDLKQINDKFGHHIGDQVILDLAHLLKTQLRPTDFIARYGGDEFILVFPNTTKQQAQIAIDRIAQAVQKLNSDPSREYQLAFSYGIAEWEKTLSMKGLLEKADQLMYKQKNQKMGE